MKKLFASFLLALTCTAAFAGVDCYSGFTVLSIATPTNITGNVTTPAVNVRGFEGVVSFVSTVVSNTAGAAGASLGFAIQGSSDGTNYTTLSSAAISTNTTVAVTNYAYAVGALNVGSINQYFTPGSSFSVNAAYTNGASATYQFGYVAAALPEFVRVVYFPTGTTPTYGGAVTLIGKRGQPY